MKALLVCPNHVARSIFVGPTTLSDAPALYADPCQRIAEILDHLHDGASVGVAGAPGTPLENHIGFFAAPRSFMPGYLLLPDFDPLPIGGALVIVGWQGTLAAPRLVDATVSCRAFGKMVQAYCTRQDAWAILRHEMKWHLQASPEQWARRYARHALCAGRLRSSQQWDEAFEDAMFARLNPLPAWRHRGPPAHDVAPMLQAA